VGKAYQDFEKKVTPQRRKDQMGWAEKPMERLAALENLKAGVNSLQSCVLLFALLSES